MAFCDQHLPFFAVEPAIAALIGAGTLLLAAGLTLRWSLTAGSRSQRTTPPSEPSLPPCLRVASAPSRSEARAATAGPVDRVADLLDRSRRLAAAEERVARELAAAGGWLVERYVLIGAQRVPFVLLGPGGVLTLCATDGAWTMYDLEVLSRLGDELRGRLPGYRGRVEAVVCLAFDDAEPRTWHGGAESGGRGGWVLGVDQLLPWLGAWEPEHGLGRDDLLRIHAAAGPHWRRRSIARLPVTGNAG